MFETTCTECGRKLKALWKLQHLGLNQVRLKAQLMDIRSTYIHLGSCHDSSLILLVPVLVKSHRTKYGVIPSRTDSRVSPRIRATRLESV